MGQRADSRVNADNGIGRMKKFFRQKLAEKKN